MNKNSHNEVEQRKKGMTPNNESPIKNGLDHNKPKHKYTFKDCVYIHNFMSNTKYYKNEQVLRKT